MFKTKAMLLPLALVIFALVYGFVYLDAKTIESGYVNQILSTQHEGVKMGERTNVYLHDLSSPCGRYDIVSFTFTSIVNGHEVTAVACVQMWTHKVTVVPSQ
ncbi:MAG: hypothetical protein UW68_C0016G0029 [Candidatus Collierbacteria bacterium GW2011_GWB1_44_6]|uniref:Uncharacterized protein n=2 Tax=Candidatus Collieribacteriota TaxID=1752725 RepID=A0A0G1MMD4_9BACT|nr:MAG: hypothetical protein UV68_C0017G0004 [Candidatus Collierbacteria bacterium GW2011_GWC2_43_12]KKT73149.1 MAG: hypothetical protein UW68_C0016G0029 [Candidatus Collierbacteria bacterium GW2011_GWB1_44_6]KKT81116.1 MAG: hypothetical protein UW80_C0058G0004 [Microgenomates group bacterium GW2011_GWC1_44_9]